MERPTEPSAVAWNWRAPEAGAEERRASERAAAHKRGAVGGVIGLTAAAVVYFWLQRPVAAAVIAGIAVLITLIAFLAPGLHRALSRGLDRFAHWVGTAVTWVLMTVLYYVLFLPVGLVLRARGRLGIQRAADPRLATYWKSTEDRPRTPESYRRQF